MYMINSMIREVQHPSAKRAWTRQQESRYYSTMLYLLLAGFLLVSSWLTVSELHAWFHASDSTQLSVGYRGVPRRIARSIEPARNIRSRQPIQTVIIEFPAKPDTSGPHAAGEDVHIRANEQLQPLYALHEDFFDDDVFAHMQDVLVEGRLAKAPTTLSFVGTSGAVMSFNLEGEQRLRKLSYEMPEVAEILRFFDAIRLPDTNAFVINILRAFGATDGDNTTVAAREHWDDTLKTKDPEPGAPMYAFVSYQTTVIYLQVPEDMEGGSYHIHEWFANLNLSLKPKENTVLAFRGDANHCVDKFKTATGKTRVSLVIEQYKILPEHYDLVRVFNASVDFL